MTPELTLSLIFVAGLLLLLASGLYIGIAFAVLGGLVLLFLRGPLGFEQMGMIAWSTVTSESLVALPPFILMGEILFAGRIGSDLFEVAYKWLGRVPGGLAVASMGACGLFASICGSSIVTTATIGTVAYPEMRRHGYDEGLAAGILTVGGGVGIMIPPSIPFIIYAVLTEQSIGRMFMAGILPGVLLVFIPSLYVFIRAWRNPELAPPSGPVPWKSRFASLRKLWTVIVLVTAVLVAIYMGIATPSEAGAVGAIVAFLIVVFYRHTPLKEVWGAVMKSIKTVAMVTLLLIGAYFLNYAVAWSGIAEAAMNILVYSGIIPHWATIPMICVAFFVMGMFMDSLAIMLLMLPILIPVMGPLGIDPIWLGVIMVLNVEIALVTPPVGLNMYIVQKISGIPMGKMMRVVWPFIFADLVALVLIIAFPIISLWLPSMMR